MKKRDRAEAGTPRRLVVTFLVKCALFWTLALWFVSRFTFVEEAGIRFTIVTLQGLFSALGQKFVREGNLITAAGTSVEIVSDCSPHLPFVIYAAVILAFPSSWRQRLIGLVFGAVVIHVFNVVRIAALIGVLAWQPAWFEFAHVYLWQTGTILVVFLTFALWIRFQTPAARPS